MFGVRNFFRLKWVVFWMSAGIPVAWESTFAGTNQQIWGIANLDYRPLEDRRLRLQLQPRSSDLIGEEETTDRDFERIEIQGSYLRQVSAKGASQLWAGGGFTLVSPLMEGIRGERRPFLELMPRHRSSIDAGTLTLDLRSRFEVRFQDQTRAQTRFRIRPMIVFEPKAQSWAKTGTLFFEGAMELFTTITGTRFQWVDQSRFMASSGIRFSGLPLIASIGPMVRFQRGQTTWIAQFQVTYTIGASGPKPETSSPGLLDVE